MRKILVHVNFYKFDVTMAREGKEYTGPAAWQLPRTLEEYEELPSTKIDLAVKIITHHLAMTGAAPLVNACPNGDRLGPDSSEWTRTPMTSSLRWRLSVLTYRRPRRQLLQLGKVLWATPR